ncbi:MAG: polyketide synthase dehydratase domain-containing protein [Pseudomonadota bacterium]
MDPPSGAMRSSALERRRRAGARLQSVRGGRRRRLSSPSAGLSPGERIMAKAAQAQSSFLSVCGVAHQSYLGATADVTQGFAGRRHQLAQPSAAADGPSATRLSGDAVLAEWMRVDGDELFVDLQRAPWLIDHCPTYGPAVLPMMSVAEIFAATAEAQRPGECVAHIRNLSLRRWIVVDDAPLRIRRQSETRPDGVIEIKLLIWREAARAAFSRDEVVASGEVEMAAVYPVAPEAAEALGDAALSDDPYGTARLFHGPAFQLLSDLSSGAAGASGLIHYESQGAPIGATHPVALDAALQAGADARWSEWNPGVESTAQACLPLRIEDLAFYGPRPGAGAGRVEMRGCGLDGGPRFPRMKTQVFSTQGEIWASIDMVLVAMPAGVLDAYEPELRRAFIRDRTHVPGLRYSRFENGVSTLSDADVAAANWVPGTLERAYAIPSGADLALLAAQKEHAAGLLGVHPSEVQIDGDKALVASQPNRSITVAASRHGRSVTVSTA